MMLRRDPRERPPIDEILNHPWMKENGTASDLPIGNEVIHRLQNFVQMGKLQVRIALHCIGSIHLWRYTPAQFT